MDRRTYGKHKKGQGMSKTKAEGLIAQLLTNAAGLRYGTVSVSVKLHDGRVVEVSYTKTEQTREKETRIEKDT